jgi:hypothetical protein
MEPGNVGMFHPRTPWALPAAGVVMTLLALTWPLIELLRTLNRTRPRKRISREAAAWLAKKRVLTSASEIGFGSTHSSRISQVLRRYLSADYPGIEGMTISEIDGLADDPRARMVKSVFRKLDRAAEKALSAAELKQLLEELDKLIPRPFTM